MFCIAALWKRRAIAFRQFTYFSREAAEERSRKKRPMDAPPKNLPNLRSGGFEFYGVWEPLPTKQKAKRIYAAPACDLASGGLFALLARVRFANTCL